MDSLCRKPFFVDCSLGRKRKLADSFIPCGQYLSILKFNQYRLISKNCTEERSTENAVRTRNAQITNTVSMEFSEHIKIFMSVKKWFLISLIIIKKHIEF